MLLLIGMVLLRVPILADLYASQWIVSTGAEVHAVVERDHAWV